MTKRFDSGPREQQETLIDAKQARFLERLARKLEALGLDPNGPASRCFQRRCGRPAAADRQGAGRKLSGTMGRRPSEEPETTPDPVP